MGLMYLLAEKYVAWRDGGLTMKTLPKYLEHTEQPKCPYCRIALTACLGGLTLTSYRCPKCSCGITVWLPPFDTPPLDKSKVTIQPPPPPGTCLAKITTKKATPTNQGDPTLMSTAREEFVATMSKELPEKWCPQHVANWCHKMFRLATTHHRLAETGCNRELSPQETDERTESRIIDLCQEAGFSPIFSGDPRGVTVKLTVPSGRTNDFGQAGICVRTI